MRLLHALGPTTLARGTNSTPDTDFASACAQHNEITELAAVYKKFVAYHSDYTTAITYCRGCSISIRCAIRGNLQFVRAVLIKCGQLYCNFKSILITEAFVCGNLNRSHYTVGLLMHSRHSHII